jgi:hypothetical protein
MIEECQCQASCEIFQYVPDIPYSECPISSSQIEFYKTYVLDHPNATSLKAYTNLQPYNTSIERGLVSKNFARLNVYIQEPIVNVHSQKASYSLPKLASDVGGTFGLWSGMSLITWCEVVELFFSLIVRQVRKIKKRHTTEQISDIALGKTEPQEEEEEKE